MFSLRGMTKSKALGWKNGYRLGAAFALLVACQAPPQDTATVQLALTNVPANVQCVSLTVAGSATIERLLPVTTGQSSVYNVAGLPAGNAQFGALAFEAPCNALAGVVPAWISDVVAHVLTSGQVTNVQLRLRRNTRAIVTLDFDDDIDIEGFDGGLVPDAGPACPSLQGPPSPAVQPVAIAALGEPITAITNAGDDRVFVATQNGRIRIIRNNLVLPQAFLDIAPLIVAGGEQGLLGLAFSPTFAMDRSYFIYYTALVSGQLHTVLARGTVNANTPDQSQPSSLQTLLAIPQPFANNNGGQLAFGPDGMLYIGVGDGGGGGDPQGNAQNLQTLRGKILRINVATQPYSIPPGNPFAAQGGRPEIWAYGLRNPWRFSFDAQGRLITADVGQSAREELNVAQPNQAGVNYQWPVREGSQCFGAPMCPATGQGPAFEYDHSVGRAIIGGFEYQGCALPGHRGNYIFADFANRWLGWTNFNGGAGTLQQLMVLPSSPTTLGQDSAHELYLGDANGMVFRLH